MVESSSKKELAKRRAFDKEALPHMDALYRTALRMTKNSQDAEDLVQEAFVKAYRFWDKFESGSNCRAWLFKIMTNIFINDYRSKSRTPVSVNVDDIDDNFLYGQLADLGPGDNPERQLFAKVFDDDVKKAIEELPDDFRMVVVLSFLEGFSYQEIADIADLQLGTVKSRLHRGRKLLQKQLYDYAIKNGYIKDTAK
ncbi:MAG: sigma-70 family RNA polymerase sigma factor [candidate division Zixibacteria bacterium]|nr:sigma-70 family RNA polymerase sigma factor [candidate division Zixibacteria bacterium]